MKGAMWPGGFRADVGALRVLEQTGEPVCHLQTNRAGEKIKFGKVTCAHGQLRDGVGGLSGANGSTGPVLRLSVSSGRAAWSGEWRVLELELVPSLL